MRRHDREMDEQFAYEVFACAPYAVMSFCGTAYGIPVSPAFLNGFVYIHCAKEGKKLDRIAQDPRVCLCAVSECVPAKNKFTTGFSSAVLFGRAQSVADDAEKIAALRAICERYTPDNMEHFDAAIQKSLAVTEILRISIEKITGKCKKI